MDVAIPAFYCCYLLRSTTAKVRGKAALYIGSTPNPRRRLRQHNGLSKGGANRTSQDRNRPWEMAALVTGFPSKIAALQFEWAWQNAHLTRHISKTQRVTNAIAGKNWKGYLKWRRPPYKMTERLLNLQLLLRVKTFARWPLQVRFFAQDVYQTWQSKHIKPHRQLPVDFSATMHPDLTSDVPPPSAMPQDAEEISRVQTFEARPETQALYAIDVDGSGMKSQLQRSTFLLDGTRTVSCAICSMEMSAARDLILVCQNKDCNAASHMTCLSRSFLETADQHDELVPTSSSCPCCSTSHRWTDLVRDLSLRIRGQAELKKIFHEKGKRQVKTAMNEDQTQTITSAECASLQANDDASDDGNATEDDIEYDASFSEERPARPASKTIPDQDIGPGTEDELSLPKPKSKKTQKLPTKSPKTTKKSKLAMVADSEWDDVDEIT